MSWELFRSIVDQVPEIERRPARRRRAGAGQEPAEDGPLTGRSGAPISLFNTNGRMFNEKNGRALEAGLDGLRVSLDAATANPYLAVRGKDFRWHPQKRAGVPCPAGAQSHRSAAGLGLAHRPEGNDRRAACLHAGRRRIGVKEVYLQRLVFFETVSSNGYARPIKVFTSG